MVNVLKFQTLFAICYKIKCWLLTNIKAEFYKNAHKNSKQGRPWSDCFFRSSLICVCTSFLSLFSRQLVFVILDDFLYILYS